MDPVNNRYRSLSKNTNSCTKSTSRSKLSPNVAAAMLSLRWPPPERSIRADSDIDDYENDYRRSGSKKLYQKKCNASLNDKQNCNVSDDEDEPREYVPFTIPNFDDVHTSWPGFEHEPVPNWQEKYMIAKPYPRTEEDVSKNSSYINYGNDSELSLVSTQQGVRLRKTSKSRSKSKRKTNETNQKDGTARQRRNIRVERIGSCTK